MERRLGKGLGALLGTEAGPGESRTELPIAQIRPNPHQPRKAFSPTVLAELQDSIRQHGILQPIAVRTGPSGYEIIAGERRWRAAQALGMKTIPAVVRGGVSDQEMLELALVENLQRADLDPIEKAKGFKQLLERGLTQEEVASRVGLNRSTVANFLRLLELSDSVQRVLVEGLLTMGHARALLSLPDKRRQDELCALAVRKGLSVRDVEGRARELASRTLDSRGNAKPSTQPSPPWIRDLEGRMRAHLGSKIEIRNREGYVGEIAVHYHGKEDLDRLLGLLAPKRTV
jgi:ParB family chromosome partitioning protein